VHRLSFSANASDWNPRHNPAQILALLCFLCLHLRRICLTRGNTNILSIYTMAYVPETRCLYVGGDFSSTNYSSVHGYSISDPPGSNLRSLCRVHSHDGGKDDTPEGANQEIDLSDRMLWDPLGLEVTERKAEQTSVREMPYPVRVILADTHTTSDTSGMC
jgi:hypothetical protein